MPEELEAPEIGVGPTQAPAASEEPSGEGTPSLLAPEEEAAPAPPSPEPDAGPAPEFDLKTVDFRRDKPEDWPDEYREALTHQQNQFKAVQGDRGRELSDFQRREESLDARERELNERESRVNQAPPPAATPPEGAPDKRTLEQMEDMIDDPNTDQNTRNALKLVTTAMKEEMAEALAPIQKTLESYSDVEQAVTSMTGKEQQDHLDALQGQINEAVDAHDAADIDRYSDGIRRLIGVDEKYARVAPPMLNPATGEAHTVLSAYEALSGITGAAAALARTEDQEIRDEAKEGAAELPAVGSPPGEPLSEAEIRAQVKALGFGQP
tara:strand:- start:1444 stop:2415 length:972 start_codon:yes stop_codon:yes gene_type:complete